MDSGINEGFDNSIIVQAESSLAGSVTGTAYHLPGKVSFAYEPQLDTRLGTTNIWRHLDGDSFSARHFNGSFDLEYSHGETFALLLASLLRRSGSSPNYTFTPYHLSNRLSLAISLSYQPNGPHFVFRGVIIDAVSFVVRSRELVKAKFEFKAAKLTTDGPLTSPTTETRLAASGLQAAAEYETVAMPHAYDASFQIAHRVTFCCYGEDAIPTEFEPNGVFTVSADLAEWMPNTLGGGDRIASDVRNMSEASAEVSIVPAVGKLLELSVPRAIMRSGTPLGLQPGGIGYRAGLEAQTAEARTDKPVLTMTL